MVRETGSFKAVSSARKVVLTAIGFLVSQIGPVCHVDAAPIASAQELYQQAYVKASNTGPDDVFGQSVSISGSRMAVGAPGEDSVTLGINGDQQDDSAEQAGAAYLFHDVTAGQPIIVNSGLNDARYSPTTNGQGFLIAVFPGLKEMFLAWFTFDTERPPEEITAMLGEPGHR